MTDSTSRLSAALSPRYVDLSLLAEGGMGDVYHGRDAKLDRPVAVKVLKERVGSATSVQRFKEEIRIVARLQHPHIVPLFDAGEADGHLFYVMPFVPGENLRDRLDRVGPFSISEALEVSGEVASALDYAHREGVVHRDVKPANVLLTPAGAMVLDFGIARAREEAGGLSLTRTGVSPGTPIYMSPEQWTGAKELDGRSDQYSLACVVYELLSGSPPFHGETERSVMGQHIHQPPPMLSDTRPEVPEPVAKALSVGMAKDPASRFESVTAFQQALTGEIGLPTKNRFGSPFSKLVGRGSKIPAIVLSTLVLAFFLYWLIPWAWPPRVETDANRIVVYPLQDTGTPSSPGGMGSDLVTYIGYILDGTDPLTWVEGQDVVPATEDPESLDHRSSVGHARAAGAGFFINGSVLRAGDSTTVILRLYDSDSGDLVQRSGRTGLTANGSEFRLAGDASVELISGIIEPGRPIDVAALSLRSPAALASFRFGEVAYRAAHFEEATDHYRAAIREDSTFALAAARAAQAASWIEEDEAAVEFASLATRQDSLLPPKYRDFAWGIFHHHNARPDSAIARFQRALENDPRWSEAQVGLAEVYYHQILGGAVADSLADIGFREALALDPDFRLPAYHLAEMAIRRGDIDEATRLVGDFGQTHPDSVFQLQLDLMLRCARDGPNDIPWDSLASQGGTSLDGVRDASQALSAGGRYLSCAEAGARAALQASGTAADRWGAFLLVHNILLAQDRRADLLEVMDSDEVAGLPARRMLLMDVTVDPSLLEEAESEARALLERGLDANSPTNLWLLGQWAYAAGDETLLQEIAEAVSGKAADSNAARDLLIADILAARLSLLRGEAASFADQVEGLAPSGSLRSLLWDPWEAAAGERLALAREFLEQGDYEEALAAATELESHRAVVNLAFLPESLEVRIAASDALDDRSGAEVLRTRLREIRGTENVSQSPPQAEGG